MAEDFSKFVSELEQKVVETDAPTNIVVTAKAGLPEKPKMKLLLVAPDVNLTTGSAKVTHSILGQLNTIPWLSTVHFAIQGQQNQPPIRKPISSVKTVSAAQLEEYKGRGYALKEFITTVQKENPNIILIYNEIGIISGYLEELRRSSLKRTFQVWSYIDTNYDVFQMPFIDMMNRDCDRVFVYSKLWRERMKEQGVTRPIDIMNLGVDTKTYRAIPKEIARQSAGIPKDVFMFLNASKNIPRKRLDLLLIAFVELITKYPTKPIFLMCIADKGDKGGYLLFDIFAKELEARGASIETFSNRLLISSQQVPYRDEDMNMFYNMADVGISTCEAEGWGLTNLEAMSVGVPQIVPDIIGFKEYCNEDNSILVKPTEYHYLPSIYAPTGGIARCVTSSDIMKAMEKYLLENSLRELHAAKSKEIIKYSWEKSVKTLVRRMEELGDDGEE